MIKKITFIRANKIKYGGGGAEVYLSRLSEALARQSISHSIVHSIFPEFLPSWIRVLLFNLQTCLTKGDKFYFSLERITCPDIYRAGDGVHKVYMRIENKSIFNLLHVVYLFIEKRCFENAKHIIANSQMIKDEIIATYDIDPKKISVVYSGMNFKKIDYPCSFAKLSKEFSIQQNKKILLYVGSGFKRKGVEEFLHIVARLKNKDLKAFIVGRESNSQFYCQLAKQLKIDNQVVFTGIRDDVDDFYAISDIFLLPTHYDPFSNVVLEAMSFENAVFTTKQNGASEILKQPFIMENPKDFSIVEKIDNLLNNAEDLQNIKQQNKFKSAEFSIDANLEKTLAIINGANEGADFTN